MAAYERRYRRQLRDIGVATAIAQHDPSGLDQAFSPQSQRSDYDRTKKWW